MRLFALLLALLLAAPMAHAEEADPFAYDARAPLQIRITDTRRPGGDGAGATIQELTYAGKAGPVPATLVVPTARGRGRKPAVLFLHWGEGSRSEFLDEALGLARLGVVSLSVDAPFARPGYQLDMARQDQDIVQTIVDLRRGLDLLAARPDVDARRLGYVGHSVGATLGGVLVGADKRLRAAVLMAGLPSLTRHVRDSQHRFFVALRQSMSREAFAALLARTAPLDAEHWVERAAPTALFFQFARKDEAVSLDEADAFVQAASFPRIFRFYDGGHELGPRAREDRARFLQAQLGFAAVPGHGLPRFGSEPRVIHELPGMEQVPVARSSRSRMGITPSISSTTTRTRAQRCAA